MISSTDITSSFLNRYEIIRSFQDTARDLIETKRFAGVIKVNPYISCVKDSQPRFAIKKPYRSARRCLSLITHNHACLWIVFRDGIFNFKCAEPELHESFDN